MYAIKSLHNNINLLTAKKAFLRLLFPQHLFLLYTKHSHMSVIFHLHKSTVYQLASYPQWQFTVFFPNILLQFNSQSFCLPNFSSSTLVQIIRQLLSNCYFHTLIDNSLHTMNWLPSTNPTTSPPSIHLSIRW